MKRIEVFREDRKRALELLRSSEIRVKEVGDSLIKGRPTYVFGIDEGDAEKASATLEGAKVVLL